MRKLVVNHQRQIVLTELRLSPRQRVMLRKMVRGAMEKVEAWSMDQRTLASLYKRGMVAVDLKRFDFWATEKGHMALWAYDHANVERLYQRKWAGTFQPQSRN